jgi:hypothetical protein
MLSSRRQASPDLHSTEPVEKETRLTGIPISLAFSNKPGPPATGSSALAGGTPISSAGTTGLGCPGTTGAVFATGPVSSNPGREREERVPTVGADESMGGGMNGAVIVVFFDR